MDKGGADGTIELAIRCLRASVPLVVLISAKTTRHEYTETGLNVVDWMTQCRQSFLLC